MAKTLTEKLCKNDWKYTLTRMFWAKPNFKRYYRHFHVIGKENIPAKGPLIYAGNHQGALMDAMAVVSTQKHQTVFIARGDIFKKPLIRKILHFMRILPIYRKRDGCGNNYDNNQETFEIVDKVLRAGMVHGVFPEGAFNPRKRLATLQKAAFRTALKAQEMYGSTGGVQIVPLGLNWQNQKEFFKDVTIVYGKPIAVAEYFSLYQENPAKAYLKMQERLAEELRKLMIDIHSETHYTTIENFREAFGYDYAKATQRNPDNPKERLEADQELVKKLDDIAEKNEPKIQDLEQTFSQYQNGLQKLNIRSRLLRYSKVPWYELLEDFGVLLLGFPIAVIGAILGFLPLSLAKKYEKMIKDPQFLSSTRYVVAMTVRGLQNFILIIILLLTCYNKIILFVFFLALILYAERLMLFYVEHYKRTIGKWRYVRLLRKNDALLNELKRQREEMLSELW
ncbi:MAG: 1-acyl-sn-glycerol-3-phosphate acyltransferase [Bacteroidales bacterium]|jgi:1-acyl-sn-glycerol-3-phosphate acyltransferase|nr:1-acyl-sn-glycerol-3-phosphate acyltransferase [Bacteroidales bacterium]